ncbi:MAG: TIGR00282 family metallophosphoesterase [Nitrospirae bacterium]|nr:TIGR00282 family metallophosphoesterase [Nitrospirota bacterium]
MRVLFVGDVVGGPGRRTLFHLLPELVDRHRAELIIANVENAAGGFGITPAIAEEFFAQGVQVLTSGNHIWDKKEVLPYLDREPRLLRPANYPPGCPGQGSLLVETAAGERVAVLQLMGRVFMPLIDCPFQAAERLVPKLRAETPVVIVDMHAEATSEKMAMAHFLDGQVSAVIGTHTHVQTADERIFPKGTAYMTDVGMTGPVDAVIGMRAEQVLDKFRTQMPNRFEVAKGSTRLSAVLLNLDAQTGRAKAIERIQLKGEKT